MRILFITNQFNPPRSAGSARSSSLIYGELKKRGHQVDLLVFDEKSYEKDYKNTIFYDYYRKLNYISVISEFIKIKDGTYDIIHQYGDGIFKFLLPAICKNFKKTKVVTTFNGTKPACWNSINYDRNSKKCCRFPKNVKCSITAPRKRFALFYPIIYLGYKIESSYTREYDRYFTQSNSNRLLLSKAGFDKSKIKIIPNFYDPELYDKIKLKSRKKSERIIILHVGRIAKQKGVQNLIMAFKKINNTNVELRIMGDGPLRKIIQMENKNNTRIKFLGLIPYNSKEFVENYTSSDIFVHAGIFPEPFNRTILEAAISKNAIIVSNIGAPPEILQDNALTYEPHDIQGLTDCLTKLINNSKKREELALNAHNQIIKEYNLERSISRLELEYEELLRKSS